MKNENNNNLKKNSKSTNCTRGQILDLDIHKCSMKSEMRKTKEILSEMTKERFWLVKGQLNDSDWLKRQRGERAG